MNYLQAENLKHKRTFPRKLLVLAPLLTALISAFAPLWFQLNSYNWWYVLLCPGFLTLICSLVEQRDNSKRKYSAVLPLPISLYKFWRAKIGISAIYSFIGNLIFLVLNLLGGFALLTFFRLPMTISAGRAIGGSICIFLISLWEIPLCLLLSKKWGSFVTVLVNTGLGSILGIFAATSSLWLVCPYSWVPHLMITILHIMPNGEPVTTRDMDMPLPMILLTALISFALFAVLSFCTAKWFEHQEVK